MARKSSLTRRSALGLLAGGGALLAVETFGFSFISTERLTSIGTAGDEDALIALVEEDYDAVPRNSFLAVAQLTNNIADDADVVTYQVSTNQDGVSINFDGQEGDVGETLTGSLFLAEGETEPIELECSQPGQIDGQSTLNVQMSEVNGPNTGISISEVDFDLDFVCEGGPVLSIDDVRGLADSRSFQDFQPEVDVSETNNTQTDDLSVRLEVEGEAQGTVFDETKQAPGNFGELANDTVTVDFDIGEIAEDEYTYTVTADADNATSETDTNTFVVDDEILVIDLDGDRVRARDLSVLAHNRSGEPVHLVAVQVVHDPDNESNSDRTAYETLEIDIGNDGTAEASVNGGIPEGQRVDHDTAILPDAEDAFYLFEGWDGGGNISGETFEITIWGEVEDLEGNFQELAVTDRVTV